MRGGRRNSMSAFVGSRDRNTSALQNSRHNAYEIGESARIAMDRSIAINTQYSRMHQVQVLDLAARLSQ